VAAASDPENSPTITVDMTRTGMILGTAAYMAPEQARGKAVDKRADIWAFGVVFSEMLTGRKLFEGETVSDILAGVLRAEPDWSKLPDGTPPNIRRLLRRCLERDPRRRLRDIGDASLELDAPEQLAPAPSRKSFGARWRPWIAAAFIAAAGIGWGVLHTSPAPPRPVIRWSYTQESGFGSPALSRDGTHLAFTEIAGLRTHLMLRNLDDPQSRPIPGAENGRIPVFSPDGQWIAYLRGRGLTGGRNFEVEKIPVTGGTSIVLCGSAAATRLAWGDDGTIVFGNGEGLMRISASGGTPEVLTTADSKKGETAHGSPYFLPGANALLFTIRSGTSSQVAVLDMKTRGYHVLVNNASTPRYIATGHLLFTRGQTVFALPFDARRLAANGSEVPVIENAFSPFASSPEYAVSDSGLLAYTSGGTFNGNTMLGWADRKGAFQPVSDPQDWGTHRLSPDGRRVATSLGSRGTRDLWIYETDRRTLTRLTSDGQNQNPVWTPDGRRIVYVNSQAGKAGLYSVVADGSGKPELLLAGDAIVEPYSFTPDGKTLFYSQRGPHNNIRIWALSAPGKPVSVHDSGFSESEAQVSPNGRWLAYVSTESGPEEIYVSPWPGPGAKTRISTQGGFAPRWSRNGRELLYWGTARSSLVAVDIQSDSELRVGMQHELFSKLAPSTWDPAPDGVHFLVEETPEISKLTEMTFVVNWFDELRHRVPAR